VRKVVDCRDFPSESGCSLTISGTEDEVLDVAAHHAVTAHGHDDSPELRAGLRSAMRDEDPAGRFGTILLGRPAASPAAVRQASERWTERRVPGHLKDEALLLEDGRLAVAVFFDSEESYRRLGEDPEQAQWWQQEMAPLWDGDVEWLDGRWDAAVHRKPPLPVSASA
jgi:hypothetical protein